MFQAMKFSILLQKSLLKRQQKPLQQKVKKQSLKQFQSLKERKHIMYEFVHIKISHRAKSSMAAIQKL